MQANQPDAEVEDWLKVLGVESLSQWDVLIFLCRHQTALVGADHISRLLGYATEPVVDALDALESLRLVERSRVSQGARLYQFIVPTEPPRREAFERLFGLAGHRAGRLLLSEKLRQTGPPQGGAEAARRFREEARQAVGAAEESSRGRDERRGPWRKAI